VFDALPQKIGLGRIQTLADDRAQRVAQRLRHLLVAHASDLGPLDRVASVDVVVAPGLVLTSDDEEHARFAADIHDGTNRSDVVRPLGLDARREFVEALLFQRSAGEIENFRAKARTQAIDIDPCHLR
jgi:hypothetical protein